MSCYVHIDETAASPFQTSPFQRKDLQRVSIVVLAILDNHLAQSSWQPIVHKGSVTISSESHPGLVLKVFVDYQGKLADKCSVHLHEDPIVVGLELTHQPAYLRETVRNELKRAFRFYIDPRESTGAKWWLKPIDDHFYDIIFLEKGPCEFEFSEERLEKFQIDFDRVIQEG